MKRWATWRLTQCSEHRHQREPLFPYNHHCDRGSLVQGERSSMRGAGAAAGTAGDRSSRVFFEGHLHGLEKVAPTEPRDRKVDIRTYGRETMEDPISPARRTLLKAG